MGHLKLKDGTTFPLNLSVGDIRDISKRSGAFSKTVTLVGDDDNNNLLNHYYDVNVIAGTFDVNKLQQCQVIQNGIVILDNAYMQLVEVVKSQTTDAHNQQIEYKVLVKDSVSDFFTKLGNKTLNDINMEEIVTGGTPVNYTASNVTGSFNNTITDGYKFLMPIPVTPSLYNLKAFHPALYAKTYFDAIFQGAGFTYEWGNQSPNVHTTNNNYFEKLLIPYNGGTPQIDRNDYLVEATKAYTPTTTTTLWESQITNFTEVTDIENVFDPVNGDYAVPFYIQNPENVQVQVTLDVDVDLVNNDYATYPTVYAADASTPGSGLPTARYFDAKINVDVQATGQAYSQRLHTGAGAGQYGWPVLDTLTSAITPIASNYTVTLNIPVTNVSNTDILEFYIQSIATTAFSSGIVGSSGWSGLYYQDAGLTTQADVDLDITINSSSWKILPSSDSIGYQSDLNLNSYVPKKVKQADFIKSIFMMYNLYAEVDASQPNKFILKHRDDYYDDGTEVDWTEKLAKDKDQTLQFLPELSAKKMVLSYKDDKDEPNEIYKEATNETYGQIEYTFENEYVKGIDRKELIFSPTPITTTNFNAFVPYLGYIPETNVRILIDGGTQTCDEYGIVDYYINGGGYSGATAQTTAPLITHFDDPVTPSFDLNFAVCDYYFYNELSTRTNNNLYNLYWRRTIGQIDKGKMLTAFFDLNEVDIQSLNLNDKIRIDNSWWNINRVIDYDANEHKLTKVELISVDEEIEFTPFADTPTIPDNPIQPPVRPVRPVKPTKPQTVRPSKEIRKKNIEATNIINGDAIVMGMNNYIGSDVTKAIVLGDDNIVEENKVLAPTIEATEKFTLPDGTEITDAADITGLSENFANTDLTLDNTRTHSLNGFSMSMDNSVAEVFSVSDSGFIGNDDGADIDFRIEGDLDQNLFFTDASVDKVGIGTSSPSAKLDVFNTGTTTQSGISSETAGTTSTSITNAVAGSNSKTGGATMNNGGYFRAYNNSNNNTGVLGLVGSSWTTPVSDVGVFGNVSASGTNLSDSRAGYFRNEGTAAASATRYGVYGTVLGTETGDSLGAYFVNSASSAGVSNGYAIDASITGNNAVNTALRLSSSGGTTNNALVSLQGGVVFNESATDSDFRIEGQTDANLFFVDASTNRVGIGTNAPEERLNLESNSKLKIGFAADAFKSTLSSNALSFDRAGYSYIDQADSSGSLSFRINNIERFRVAPTEIVLNDTAGNYDTRVEGQTDANLFFADASTDRIGIGTNTPSSKLHIESTTSALGRFTRTSTTTNVGFEIGGSSTESFGLYDYTNSFYRWDATKTEFVINDSAANYDTRIEGQTDANLFFVDASTNRVGIGTNTPSYKLDVNGDINVPTGSAYYHNGTAGLSGTYTFGGGSTGDIATMTFSGGILTAVTTVP